MTNKGYSESRRDYVSPEEERYSRPNYETAEEYNKARREREQEGVNFSDQESYNSSEYEGYSSPEYERAKYNDTTYDRDRYANLGGEMVDGDGVTVRNYFPVQVAFAVVEILCCCCMNIGTMVLGIIALVFAIQANQAYTDRRVGEHKSKSKISTILLIVGGVWMAISVLFNVLIFSMTLSDDVGMEELLEDVVVEDYYDDYDGEYTGTDDVPLVEGFNTFTYEGVSYSIPMPFAEFEEMGFALQEDFAGVDIGSGDYEWIYFCDDAGDVIGEVQVYNSADDDKLITDCDIIYITFYYDVFADDAEVMDVTFIGGIRLDSTYEEIEAIMGVPTYTYAPDDGAEYARYSWYYYGENGEYEGFDIAFWEGELEEITIEVQQY